MDIKPKFDTGTIQFNLPVKKQSLSTKVVKDPNGVISNGIYKVIRWESLRQIITLSLSGAVFLAMGILIGLYAGVYHTAWISFVVPCAVALLSGYKAVVTLVERGWLRKAVDKYKEDLKIGLTSTPPFIARLYVDIHKKQIGHNWLTFFLLLNGGIITVLLWWLKDAHWWIFKFDEWIHSMFANPTLMSWIFTIALISIAALHIVMAIQRKKRILDIDAYFGSNIVPMADLEQIKATKNKTYRNLFIWYVMIVVIIPILIKLIIKVLRRK